MTADISDTPAQQFLPSDALDIMTFSQIIEMDDADDHEFSVSIIFGFFDQVEETLQDLDKALEERNMDEIYRLGHFLKGSSATIGLIKVRDACEKIQRYGKLENLDGTPNQDKEQMLEKIEKTTSILKSEYSRAEKGLRAFYAQFGE
ncbi:osomolarity two-component system, phosphorelay intermediate protein YPD1 [Geosmithia morbida]|uniref:Osomolarity two-component system, phosphorelay intermediate protein YPD1 n=1 Tax=Geosmithia morbida TaxID=1094350 RepID=A0A9P5D2N5_9HYPO|nr:osomolarity two-component system, phosphorelay intermediate protein YPD1 [Geosmithia morbida]KAF4121651.1 osomolarity two-component system, phosphorelay intermediate protein YPD1 [Geosmithia morbida]